MLKWSTAGIGQWPAFYTYFTIYMIMIAICNLSLLSKFMRKLHELQEITTSILWPPFEGSPELYMFWSWTYHNSFSQNLILFRIPVQQFIFLQIFVGVEQAGRIPRYSSNSWIKSLKPASGLWNITNLNLLHIIIKVYIHMFITLWIKILMKY